MKVHNTGYVEPLTESQLIYLPDIDGAPDDGGTSEALATHSDNQLPSLIRRKLRYGDSMEWNPEPGTPQHAALEAARHKAAK
jgi:hypothetical protein